MNVAQNIPLQFSFQCPFFLVGVLEAKHEQKIFEKPTTVELGSFVSLF